MAGRDDVLAGSDSLNQLIECAFEASKATHLRSDFFERKSLRQQRLILRVLVALSEISLKPFFDAPLTFDDGWKSLRIRFEWRQS